VSGHYGGDPTAWDGGTNAPHIARYFIARGWVLPHETVLDVACATGYGTKILASSAKKAIGIEVDPGCIEVANSDNPIPKQDNTEFILADLDKIELPDADVIVSIETCEHVQNFPRFAKQIQKHARRLFIISVPLGGTSYAYTDEEKLTPAGEGNDFNNMAHLEGLFTTKKWRLHTSFEFGYSGYVIFVNMSYMDKRGRMEWLK
jgi:protein-L-isoaspartate O-methyltransferase